MASSALATPACFTCLETTVNNSCRRSFVSSTWLPNSRNTRSLRLVADPEFAQHPKSGACTSIRCSSVPSKTSTSLPSQESVERIITIRSRDEFKKAMADAESKSQLVIVEYTKAAIPVNSLVLPAMQNITNLAEDIIVFRVMGDESDELRGLCQEAGVKTIPYFVFYKDGERVHEEKGFDEERLKLDVIYYRDATAPLRELTHRDEFEAFIQEHIDDNVLLVVDVSVTNCGPCVVVYPTVLHLAKKFEPSSVQFARLIGDANDSCKDVLHAMGVVEVPTFLFIRNGQLEGRYVGSAKGDLVGEILRYQGVQCT